MEYWSDGVLELCNKLVSLSSFKSITPILQYSKDKLKCTAIGLIFIVSLNLLEGTSLLTDMLPDLISKKFQQAFNRPH